MNHRPNRRGRMMIVFLIGVLLLTSADKCGSGQGVSAPPAANNGDALLDVITTGRWSDGTDPSGRPRKRTKKVEVSYTVPGKNTQSFSAGPKAGHYSFEVMLRRGQRVSITIDQSERGFIQCDMFTGAGRALAYEHRNDAGSVTCAYTWPLQAA